MKLHSKKKIILILAVIAAAMLTIMVSCVAGNSARSEEGAENAVNADRENSEILNFLLLGSDRASGLTDVMMLVSFDSGNNSLNILQIPRDTYAEYSERSYKKINGAMSVLGGGDALCEFLSEAMCIDIEGYFLFDLDAFAKLVDAVGGVEIDLPFDMDYRDPYQNLSIHLKAGKQTLDGAAAEKFVRYRSGYVRGDIGRLDAQKIFISSFVKKVTEEITPTSVVKIVGALMGEVKTDLGLANMTELALGALDLNPENINMMTLAGEDIRISDRGAWYYVISKDAAIDALREGFGIEIDEGEFDKNGVFLNSENENFSKIYYSEKKNSQSNAADINKNGIDIERQ